MATTTNYGWTTPDNTDLVKDGALAIRTLGSAIDTSMNTALGTKKAGMVLLNTTSFSAVASASLNNIFSSTYDKYFIGLTYATSASSNLRFRFRESGADITTGYYGAGWEYDYAGGSGVKQARNNGGDGDMGQTGTTLTSTAYAIITSEKGAGGTLQTTLTGQAIGAASPINFGYQSANGSADGISFFPTSGTITLFISVYGMNR